MKPALSFAAFVTCFLWAPSLSAEMLPGSEWGPTELNAESFVPIQEIFLKFEQDRRFFGNAGCNTFRGHVVTNGDAILFGPAATTRMACPEDIAAQEFDFLQTLSAVRLFERNGLDLALKNADGDVIMRLVQRDAD